MAAAEVHDHGVAAVALERLVQDEDISHRLGHLLAVELDHAVVDPQLRQRRPVSCPCLRRLVLVVGKDEI